MIPSKGAITRRGNLIRSGRASYVWQWYVLVPIACGVAPDGVEIRLERSKTWHRITYTPDEAYDLIIAHYNKGTRRTVESHRRKRGLPVR